MNFSLNGEEIPSTAANERKPREDTDPETLLTHVTMHDERESRQISLVAED
jgi:hypothetical protein